MKTVIMGIVFLVGTSALPTFQLSTVVRRLLYRGPSDEHIRGWYRVALYGCPDVDTGRQNVFLARGALNESAVSKGVG